MLSFNGQTKREDLLCRERIFALGVFAVGKLSVINLAVRKFRRIKSLPYGYFAV